MRIWWVVDAAEYWLEPVYQITKNGKARFEGCKLYNAYNQYKGWWPANTWPPSVRAMIRDAVQGKLKRDAANERLERVRTRSMIGKTKD